MSQQHETKFKKRIRPLLDSLDRSWWVKTQMVALLGIPDFLGCVNGHFVALELKRGDRGSRYANEATKLQAWVLQKIKAAGGFVFVVTPENWDEIYPLLQQISKNKIISSEPGRWDS